MTVLIDLPRFVYRKVDSVLAALFKCRNQRRKSYRKNSKNLNDDNGLDATAKSQKLAQF